jgi:hypothetical protein
MTSLTAERTRRNTSDKTEAQHDLGDSEGKKEMMANSKKYKLAFLLNCNHKF